MRHDETEESDMAHANASPQANGSAEIDEFDAIVVGAGLSGVYLLHRLRKLGLSVRVLEAGTDVGGTWYWNRYPGARCDTESMFYAYSWPTELRQKWTWTSRYPDQDEIQGYISHVTDEFDLRKDIQFETRVAGATFDEATNRWAITTEQGETFSARFCVMATGCITKPNLPDWPGVESFEGDTYHTARWPKDDVDFTGKHVAVVGTGSTGIQAIPMIAKQAEQLTVFQRTPNYAIPAWNGPLDPEHEREVKDNYDKYWDMARWSSTGLMYEVRDRSVFEDTEDVRELEFEDRWQQGGFSFLFAYKDILTDRNANELVAEFVRNKIRGRVDDPETAELLCPNTHPFASKRLCVDTNYYETYNRDNVTLVNVRKTPIEEMTSTGLRTSDESHELDAIIFATGFDSMTGALFNIDIRGRSGEKLKEKWADGPRTYLGLGTAGFPNLFTITGPGSPSVISNMMTSIEQHVDWVSDCIEHLVQEGMQTIEPRVDAEDDWVEHVNEVANTTLFPEADSWYTGANVPGKPRIFTPYVGGVGTYRKKCDEVAANGYEGFVLA